MTMIRRSKSLAAAATLVAGACFLSLSRSAAPRANLHRQLRAVVEQFKDPKSTQARSTEVASMPLHMIQIGQPRTATTYQQHIVCLSLFLSLEGGPTYEHPLLGTLDTRDLLQKMICARYSGKAQEYPPDVPVVIKTHEEHVVGEQQDLEDPRAPMWVFFSMSQEKNYYSTKIPHLMYVQEVEELKERGHEVVNDYTDMFGLSDSQVKELIEYLGAWDVLRQCCGLQMSKGWRNELLPDDSPLKIKVDPNGEPHKCNTYNIEEVERTFMGLELYQRIVTKGGSGMSHASRPSWMDGELDGSYCTRYNELVRTEGVGFDEGVGFGEGHVVGWKSQHEIRMEELKLMYV